MNNLRRFLAYGGLVLLLAGAGGLGYWWYSRMYLPEPTPETREELTAEEAAEEVGVTLPEDLEEDLERDRSRQKELYNQAVQAHDAGNFEEAVELYRQVIAHSGRDRIAANAYRYLGDIYSRSDQHRQALRLYDFSLEIRPDAAIVHYRKGMTFWDQGELDSAGESLDRAIELEPAAGFQLARGNLHLERERYAEAEETYENGIEQGGGDTLRLHVNLALARHRQGKTVEAIDTYGEALALDPDDDVRYRMLMNRGDLYAERENYSEAVEAFDRARRIDDTVRAYYNLGLARADNDNLTGAAQALNEALSRSPDDVEILTDLAHVYESMKDYENAIEYYDRALEQESAPDVLFALGRLHERTGQPREALSYYERVVSGEERSERLRMVYRRVGELYLSTDQPERAAPAFRNVISIDEDNAQAHYNLGLAYRRTDQLDRAIDSFRRAFELSSESARYQLALADTLYRAGYDREAQSAYGTVAELDPSRHDASYMVAYLDYKRGDLAPARKKFQSLIERLDDETLQAKTYQNLGNIYLRNQQYSDASTSYRQALEIRESAETYFNFGLVKAYEENWEVAATVFRRALDRRPDDPEYQTALGLVLYQKGLYREAQTHLENALSESPDSLRTQYDLRRVRETLREIEARTS